VLGYPFVFIHNNFLRKILKQGFKIYQPVLEEPSEGHNGQRDWINEFETCVKNTEKVVNNTQEEILKDTIKWNQEHAMILYQETINNIAKIIPNFYNYAGEIFCKTVKLQEENT
jgi:asparagine synthetase A